MLVGNKVDLVENDPNSRQVNQDSAAEWARQHGLLFSESSSVTSKNVKFIASASKHPTPPLMDGGKLDESQKALLPYEINEETWELIIDEVNPNRTLLQKPAVSDGAE